MIFIFKAYIDGSSHRNPGPSGIGIVVYNVKDEVVFQKGYFIGSATNNQAEYRALIKVLEFLQDRDASVVIYTDSELLAKQWQLLYKVRDTNLRQLYEKAKSLAKGKSVRLIHIDRRKNKLADSLANKAVDEHISAQKEKEKVQLSAGGVVYQKKGKYVKVCLIAKKGKKIWTLPRGRVEPGEDPRQTAQREVYEETGFLAQVKEKIHEINYNFKLKETDTLYHKSVIFYLMPLVSAKQQGRDAEADEVKWFTLDEAYKKITRLNEKEVVKKVKHLLV